MSNTKKFALLTTGRTGSTGLMDSLAGFADIAVPNKQIDCRDNELLHPTSVERISREYQRLSGMPVTDELSLIRAFYQCNEHAAYAGFKSMPNRHRHLRQLLQQENLQVITLIRQDLASTVASFIIAIDAGTWRRDGGEQINRFTFGPDYEKRALGHLTYILNSVRIINAIPGAIPLVFEQLCEPGYSNAALDNYFNRPVALAYPKKPTSGSEYVENWELFKNFIHAASKRIQQNQPA
ncbi:MAG: hypothetical protein VW985_02335 [Gammaproteobacteria bacterium]